ncbi:MAG: PAS domain S-box protein [Desulfatiglandaceae bacterium]
MNFQKHNGPLNVWREHIFFAIFLSGVLIGLVSYLSTLRYAILKNHFTPSLIFYSAVYLCAIVILLVRHIPFAARAAVGVFLFYALGLATLMTVGPMGNGYIWLFAFAVTATLLLGLGAGIIASILNICTLFIFGKQMAAGRLAWLLTVPYTLDTWKTTLVTFSFLNCVIVISLAVLVRNLDKALHKEQNLTSRLSASNEQLEHQIAERKRALRDLAESEEKYRTLFEDSLEAMSLTLDGKIVDVNGGWLQIHGFEDKQTVLGMNITEIVHEQDRNILLERRDQWPHYKDRVCELRDLRQDGSIVDVQVYSSKIILAGKSYILATIHDITGRKQVENALRESEAKYRTILENIEEGYYEVDLEGYFTFLNDAFCKTIGNVKDQLLGMDSRDSIIQEDRDKVSQTFNRVFRTREPEKDVGWRILRPDGSQRDIEASVSLISNMENRPMGFRGIIRDVTDRKLSEENTKRLETHMQMVQRLEALGTLAGGIAHDFNNILMGIQGRTSLMSWNLECSHPHFEHLEVIDNYVENAAALTRQLLGLARGGKYEVKPVNLNKIVSGSAEMFGRTKKEITIHATYQEDLWIVEADRRQIKQVLLNMYVNAWQAMPSGGTLYLDTKNVEIDDAYIMSEQVDPGRYVRISVTDMGVGMDQATRQKIFNPFFTTKEMGRGTGLGLASAYGIIKNHGGFIRVYSEKGHGTTFNIYLPVTERGVEATKEPIGGVHKGSETVLLVDDEEMIIEVVQELLEGLGYTVLLAKNGPEALETYRNYREHIDIVVLDMIMPGMSGSETFDRLKEINPHVKIVLSSGYSMNDQANDIMNRGCDGFIEKPIKITYLSQKLREILDNPPAS